jgi:excisionase family DNA binding protein
MSTNDRPPTISNARMTPKDVAERLHVGTRAVYTMLEQGILPGIRIGKRWLITRSAYEEWERSCGLRAEPDLPQTTGLNGQPEVTVD